MTTLRYDIKCKLQSRTRHGTAPQSGVGLPPLGFRMGGEHFKDDVAFVDRALRDVDNLVRLCGLNKQSRLLDWGCGAGRLGIGIAERFGRIGLYSGIDVQKMLIKWDNRNVGRRSGFTFTWADVANARYNPRGVARRTIPAETDGYDVFYAYSVFSHMRGPDATAYLKELARVLRPNGAAWLTAFVEIGVRDEDVNPADYGPLAWRGPLHCVLFDKGYFDAMIANAGLEIDIFDHGGETDGQSVYVLRLSERSRAHLESPPMGTDY